MLIRPTSIIAHATVESEQQGIPVRGDLRQFTHTLDQQQITDTDCIVPIWHKGQLTQINRKDLSAGMSPWSAYHRDWLTGFTLDLDYVCQGITWYREVDDDGVLHAYWFKGAQDSLKDYNKLLSYFGTDLECTVIGRYLVIARNEANQGIDGYGEVDCHASLHYARNDESIDRAISRLLGLFLIYGNTQSTNGVATALKINLPITGYTRSQVTMIESDTVLLRSHGLFVHHHLTGTGMRQNLELVTNDAELLQLLLPYLQYIDSTLIMTTVDTLRERSAQIIKLGLGIQPLIAKPRTL